MPCSGPAPRRPACRCPTFVLEELERVAAYPPVVEVLARAGTRSGGASAEAVVRAVRAERESR